MSPASQFGLVAFNEAPQSCTLVSFSLVPTFPLLSSQLFIHHHRVLDRFRSNDNTQILAQLYWAILLPTLHNLADHGVNNKNVNKFICLTALSHYHTMSLLKLDLRHTHTFNGPFAGTTRVSQYQKGKTNLDIWILLKQERVSGSSISWAIYKSAPHSRQITVPAPLSFYRPDAIPAAQPTVSKHWRPLLKLELDCSYCTSLSMPNTPPLGQFSLT